MTIRAHIARKVALGLAAAGLLEVSILIHRQHELRTPAHAPAFDPVLPAMRSPDLPAIGGTEGWWSQAVMELEHREYEASTTEQGLQAPNRAHNLRTTFAEHGIEVVPRTGKGVAPAWRFGWEMSGIGRAGSMQGAETVSPQAESNRVTYRRDGWSEWYENTPQGLEQGFTIGRQPAGDGPLHITGNFPAALRAERRADGAIDFLDAHGACAIRYGAPQAWDARGVDLPAELVVAEASLAIVVDDRDAVYPLTVDPLLTSPSWTAEGDQASCMFGRAVATAGDVNGDGFSDVLVGAANFDNGQNDEGRAYLYLGSAAGLATTAAWIVESDQASALFGFSLGTAGDVNGDGFSDVIVGAPQYSNGQSNEGQAFVYLGSASGLGTTAAWTAESDQAGAHLGWSVGTAGDVNGDGFSDVIVGADVYTNGENGEGRAFVYHGSTVGLATTAAWTAESQQAAAHFGIAVGTAGDVNGDGFADVIVGAMFFDNGQTDEGRAFVYHGSAAGLSASAAWSAESNQASAQFGWSVATAGDTNGDGFADVVVGASFYDNGQTDEGRVFVYHGSAAGLSASAAWTVESNQASSDFGFPVGTAGDVNGDGLSDVIVGADAYDNGQTNEGRAFVYLGRAVGPPNVPWTAESQLAGALFGVAVATAGDVNGDGFSDVIVGAIGYDNGQTDEGGAFVYLGSGAGPAITAGWTGESDQDNAAFGFTVGTAGDVNGDGFSDVIVGAPNYDNGQSGEGRAFVYHGARTGLATTAAWTAESDQVGGQFGTSVGTAGDVNGDGYSDVIVGAGLYDNGQANEGRAFVYLGSPAGLASSAAWITESDQAGARFGGAVGTAGDVNGDGFADVVVGAFGYSNGQSAEGRAFVYPGSPTGLATTAAWTAESDQVGGQFGTSVGTAGDVNGDGFSDVIVGAPFYDHPEIEEGRAFVYLGSISGVSATANWTAESQQASAVFGTSVGTAGDVNGDGFSDVIVGAELYDNGQDSEGGAFTYLGSAAGLSTVAAWTGESNQDGGQFGVAVGTAGDVNGDGYSDVIVGANAYSGSSGHEGRAFVYHGSATGLGTVAAWNASGGDILALFGSAVATAGDVNGDGFADVIVGAPDRDNGQIDEGRASIFYGNLGPGRTSFGHQLRTDGTTPIDLLGRSNSNTQFRIRAIVPSAHGRTRLRLEHEVKPLGVLFDGQGTVAGNFVDVGADGEVELSQPVTALAPDTPYHWRVRAQYDLAITPFQPHGPWLHMGNGWNQTDLRTAAVPTGIELGGAPPVRSWLEAPRPNPFGASADIIYALPRSGRVRLAVFDATGRERMKLVDRVQPAGRQVASWDGSGARGAKLPAGVYFVRLAFDGHVETQKLVLAR